MFFQINQEKRIGFKKLSPADLGLSADSHQTHIGLSVNVLTFLPDFHVEKAAILIHDEYCDILSCHYGKIIRKNGRIEAPNIKCGNRGNNTIVKKIREFAKQKPMADWYLVWFGTDSDEIVFWLISSESRDFMFISTYLNDYRVYDEHDHAFPEIINFLEKKINGVSQEILKDLEVVSQVGDYRKKYKAIDLDKAAKRCKEIGRNGEELIYEYLKREKRSGNISNFIWENKSREVGKPFDFIIDVNLKTEKFIDVKSTSFGFSQKVIFSENEISFIEELNNDKRYYAYRVFDINEEQKKLAICNKCLRYMKQLNAKILSFHNSLSRNRAITKSVSIAVDPDVCFKSINESVVL